MPDGGFHTDLTSLRLRLLDNGFKPVPVSSPTMPVDDAGKRPVMKDWLKACAAANERAVQSWAATQPGCTNTGILTGIGGLVAVDIDVLDPALAQRIAVIATAVLGPTTFVRIGRAPKSLLLYRVLGAPLKKRTTAKLLGAAGDEAQVEMMAEGQQVLAAGIHPVTMQPYTWPQEAPMNAPLATVPETTPEALAAFLAAAEGILRAAGYAEPTKEKAAPGGPQARAKGKASDFAPATREEVADALRYIPNDCDYDGWIRIGAAIFAGLADDGEDLFTEWSATSPKFDADTTRRKWASFRTSPMTRISVGTLFFTARQNGWNAAGSRRSDGGAPPPQDDAPDTVADIELTEDGVALAFTEQHRGTLRFCHDRGHWHVWSGTHWALDRTGLAFSWCRQLARSLSRDASMKVKSATAKAAFAGAVERYAQRDPTLAVTSEAWDHDPWLLATPGGVVDLRTATMRQARQADMMTKTTSVAPSEQAECPTWLAFLQQATGDDAGLVRFLQQWAGYSLTGITREHALLFIYGPGGNGKSVFLNTVSKILGDYHQTASMDAFTVSMGDRHPTDMAMLRGARMVSATETEEGRAWAEARIRQLTGGDAIAARFMRQDFFTFTPTFKLTIAGNHKPALRNVDEAARRRFNVVPFLFKPARPDRDLEAKLMAEAPGILQWMIEGCIDWQQHGLKRPQIVADTTAEYFEAQDLIGLWLADRCVIDATLSEKPGTLASDCRTWATANGEAVPSPSQIRSALEKVPGVRFTKYAGERRAVGIGLRPPEAGWRGAAA